MGETPQGANDSEAHGQTALPGWTGALEHVHMHSARLSHAGHSGEHGERCPAAARDRCRWPDDCGVKLDCDFPGEQRRAARVDPYGDVERGRAKGYAGLLVQPKGTENIEIVGMEAIRRDWTDMAGNLQRALISLLFHDASAEEIESEVSEWLRGVRAGERDEELIYRKSLRKPIENTPKRNLNAKLNAAKRVFRAC